MHDAAAESSPDLPPEESRLAALCPRCDHRSTFHQLGMMDVTYVNGGAALRGGSNASLQRVTTYQCRGCGQNTIVVESRTHVSSTEWSGVFWWPPPASAELAVAIPETLRDAFAEGARAMGAQAPHAAAVMFRRTVEGIVRDRGSEKAVKQLDSVDLPGALAIMAKEGALDKSLAEWAGEVRGLGNVGGHFDPLEEVSGEQVADLAHLVRQLLRYLYEEPARIARLRASREPKPAAD